MLISIEALAMAGSDYIECGIDLEEWDHEEMETTPPYLLAEEEEKEEKEEKEEEIIKEIKFNSSIKVDDDDDDDDEFNTVDCHTNVGLAGCIRKPGNLSTTVKPIVAADENEKIHNKVIKDPVTRSRNQIQYQELILPKYKSFGARVSE